MKFWCSFKRVKHLKPHITPGEIETELFEKKGLIPFNIAIESVDMHCQGLTVMCKGKVLIELKLGECTYTPSGESLKGVLNDIPRIECITLEWLMVQNPFETFSVHKP